MCDEGLALFMGGVTGTRDGAERLFHHWNVGLVLQPLNILTSAVITDCANKKNSCTGTVVGNGMPRIEWL